MPPSDRAGVGKTSGSQDRRAKATEWTTKLLYGTGGGAVGQAIVTLETATGYISPSSYCWRLAWLRCHRRWAARRTVRARNDLAGLVVGSTAARWSPHPLSGACRLLSPRQKKKKKKNKNKKKAGA